MKDKGGNRDQNYQKGKAKRDDAEPLCYVKKLMQAFWVLDHFAPCCLC